MNVPEHLATEHLKELGVEYARRGYPDFAVIRNNEIIGFIEVKPKEDTELRVNQKMFQRMCEKYGIPFIKWCPDDGMAPLKSAYGL